MHETEKDIKEIIIITGGDIDDRLVSEVINRSHKPYIIGVDKGMEALERLHIVADLIVGDFDSANKSIKDKYS